jgi:hypothetical protein
MNAPFSPEDVPGLDGPDYVALVIEWDDGADTPVSAGAPERSSQSEASMRPQSFPSSLVREIATIVGALSAIALATWGLRRLRTVS